MAVGGLTIGQGNRTRITIKDMEAIERIKGYCCEVTQEQWEELVRVADDVGIKVYGKNFSEPYSFFALNYECTMLVGHTRPKGTVIPFPDFLAKLIGEEKWEPKAGEMVEVRNGSKEAWYAAEFVGSIDGWKVCRVEPNVYTDYIGENIRPARPNITRAEAESLLNKRIID